MTPAAVLLDLDDTLVDTPTAMRISVVAALEAVTGELPESVKRAVADRWIADPARHFFRYEVGEIGFTDQRRARFAEVAEIAGLDPEPAMYAAWEAGYVAGLTEWVRAFDDVLPFLNGLGRTPVAVVTNVATDLQRAKLQTAGLAERLPVVVGVDLAGSPKPAAAPFHYACRLLGVDPAEAVHIGDSLHADVVGACAAGLRAIWLDRRGAGRDAVLPAGAARVNSLTEASKLVAR